MKLTIQKEVFASTIVQHQFQVEVVLASMMCTDCNRLMAQNTWKASVQVRQKGVTHKKTFLYLEQLILKHQAHRDTTHIKECREGLDFFFQQRNHAMHFVNFMQSVVPVRYQQSQQLISSDLRSNTANYKHTISVEMMPLCKEDLLVLPLRVAKQMGNMNPLVLCMRVSGGGVTVMDVRTLETQELQTAVYWRAPFPALCEAGAGGLGGGFSLYYVMDVEPIEQKGRYMLADITVVKCVTSKQEGSHGAEEDDLEMDFDQTFITRSHLGHWLHPGDYAKGYHLQSANFNSDLMDELHQACMQGSSGKYPEIPDVILVKKATVGRRNRKERRQWKLKRLTEKQEMEVDEDLKRQMSKKGEAERRDAEWEGFLRDLEEDKELREMVNLYRDPTAPALMDEDDAQPVADENGIDLAELLEDLDIQDADPDEQ